MEVENQPINLTEILANCHKEEDVEDANQPLYVDLPSECIRCSWCPGFKGLIEAQVINQHTKKAKSHNLERK